MDVGADIIGIVKTNTNSFCKDSIYKMTKYCLGGSYLVLKIMTMVLGVRQLIALVCMYKSPKVFSFITTEVEGRSKYGINYLFK